MTLRKAIRFIAPFFLMLFAVAMAETPIFSVPMQTHTEEISLFRSDYKWYLFLPSNASVDEISVATSHKITVDSAVYDASSDHVPLQLGENKVLINGNKTTIVVMKSENIPSIFIDLDKLALEKFGKNKNITDTGILRLYSEQSILLLQSRLSQFKLHGNTSLKPEKKSFKIKLEKKQELLGMSKDKTWLLVANAQDGSYARNWIAQAIAKEIGISFIPQCYPVDLYVNKEYRGTYTLSEKIQVGKGRIPIRDLEELTEQINEQPLSQYKLVGSKTRVARGVSKCYDIPENPPDITGGYLLEFTVPTRYAEKSSAFITSRGTTVIIRSPEYATKEQCEYIKAFVQAAENAIFSEDATDPETGKKLEELVDLKSAALKYILEETMMNYDANKASQYLIKDAGEESKLFFCAPWDYDLTLGNRHDSDEKIFINPSALPVASQKIVRIHNSLTYKPWFPQLCTIDSFMAQVRELYIQKNLKQVVDDLIDPERSGSIDQWEKILKPSLTMNYTRFTFPYYSGPTRALGASVENNVLYLKDMLQKHIDYIDKVWRQNDEGELK